MSDTPVLTSYDVSKPEGDGDKKLVITPQVQEAFRTALNVPSMEDTLPELPPQVVLGNPTDSDTKPVAVPVGKGVRIDTDGTLRPGGDETWRLKDLYFAARTDSPVGGGTGTYLDPFDVSTPALFDARMTELYASGAAANLYFAAGHYYINPIRPHEVHPVVNGVYAPWYWGNAWFLNGEGMGRTVFHFADDSNLPGDATGSRILLRSSRKANDAGFAPTGCIRNITIDGGVTGSNSLPGPSTTYRFAFDLDVGIFTVENVEFVRLGGRGQEMFYFSIGNGLAAANPSAPPKQSITVTGCKSSELHHNGFNGGGFLIRSKNPGHHQSLLAYNNNFKDAYWCGADYWHIDHDAETVDGGLGNYGCYNYDTGSCHYLSFRRLKCYNGGSTQNLTGCITIGSKDPGLDTAANNWKHITVEDCYFEGREGSPMVCPAVFIAGGGVDDLKIRNSRIKKVTGQPAYGVIFYDTLLTDTIYSLGNGVPAGYPAPGSVVPNGTIREFWGNTVVDDGSVPLLLPNTAVGDASIGGVRVSQLAASSLSNVPSGAVGSTLLATKSVISAKLGDDVLSMLTGKFDPAKYKGEWTPATNTPTIPTAAGHAQEWYLVKAAGTATGNAAGTYALGDAIVSDGASWLKSPAPPTVIPKGSLPITALADYQLVTNLTVSYKGNPEVLAYAVLVSGGTKCLVGWKTNGTQIPDPADAAMTAANSAAAAAAAVGADVAPLLPFADPGGIPAENVSGWSVKAGGVWIMDDGERVFLPFAVVDNTGGKVMFGVAANGTRYPKSGGGTSNYEPADYIVFGQEAGGLGISDADGERTIIDESATWKDLQPTDDEEVWIGRSNRLTGTYGMHEVNILIPAVLPRRQGTLYGFGVTGQSLAQGWTSIPLLSTTAVHPDHNLMFNGGMFAGGQNVIINPDDMASFVPMKEVFYPASAYESPWSGCFNRLNTIFSQTMGGKVRFHCANHSWGGRPYIDIKKGKRAYNNGLYEITRAKALANAAGWDYVYLGTFMIHGENDRVLGTSAETYDGYLKELLADTAADVMAITGQSFYPRLFTDGCHSWTSPVYGFTEPTVTVGQYTAAKTESRIIMVGPKYIHPHNPLEGVHLPALSSRLTGEYFANAAGACFFGGGRWNPFGPVEVGQTSDTVWARMQTPLGHSLAFDTSLVTDPGRYGFEMVGASFAGDPVIDGDRIVIPKSGTATQLRYAFTGISGAYAGPVTGPRGCLRDTSPATSVFTSAAMHNYCNTFSEAVPPAP